MPLGGAEVVLILIVVLIIFGPGKLPRVGEAIGRSIRELRKASTEDDPDGTSTKRG
ncbi:MAG: twin-arginine translocase TatA/TatE family subunit [Candidatus Limnocylindrales bacterium]